MLFNEKLKILRKEMELTQEQLAEKLDVSRQAITKWETSEGIPDIENLKQISEFFNISIDELVKQEKDLKIEEKKEFSYIEELEIDHSKHYDINICQIGELNIAQNNEEKVRIEVLSNREEDMKDILKIKLDNLYNKLDIDIINKEKTMQHKDIKVFIFLPQKYIDDIEINADVKTMNILNLELEKLEFDGNMKYMNVEKAKGNIVLNTSKSDVEVFYEKFEGALEVNLINSTARVQIPKGTQYTTILKGIKNKFLNEKSIANSENTIELNGINSKLIIIEE